MKVVVFDQWEKLVQLVKNLAATAARDKSQYGFNRVTVTDGRGTLKDRAMNNLAVTGGTTTLKFPDIEPGRVRDLVLRVKATGENALVFSGAGSFEGEDGALDAPADGETAVYLFTETDGDVFLVSRRIVSAITSE